MTGRNVQSTTGRITCVAAALALAACSGEVPAPDGSNPTTAADEQASPPGLADVHHWLYLLDVNLDEETIDQVVASTHDLVVVDLITSEADNADFPLADLVDRLHAAAHPKLVVAYLDVGQAEDYRSYWQPGWGIGDPDWIVANDPDGWEGNYPVAYWDDEYRDLWLADGALLDQVLDAGFDGVYLDWIEAYSDDNVVTAAARDGVDPRQEMVWWVGDIAEHLRSRQPATIVIGQNAAELAAEDDDYADTIDAIAQEQVWFDGGADNDPPGDCPLPATDDDIDTDAYVESLSAACREQWEEFPDSTLHVSSQEYLRDLRAAADRGLVVLTVDYALDPDNVAWVYRTARDLGFVPFVGSRALDTYVAPWEPDT